MNIEIFFISSRWTFFCSFVDRILLTSWKSLKQIFIKTKQLPQCKQKNCLCRFNVICWWKKVYWPQYFIEAGLFSFLFFFFNRCVQEFYWFIPIELWWMRHEIACLIPVFSHLYFLALFFIFSFVFCIFLFFVWFIIFCTWLFSN